MRNTLWLITDKGDPDARTLADRHYTRQTPGAKSFTRNGQNLVFVTRDLKAVWVSFRPTPGKAVRADGLDAWECALFRNEGPILSSLLIREAVELSLSLWGPWPKDGLITYVKPECIRSRIPGYCFRRAGWRRPKGPDGAKRTAKDGKPMLKAPLPASIRHWTKWGWKGDRDGGVLHGRLRRAFYLGKSA